MSDAYMYVIMHDCRLYRVCPVPDHTYWRGGWILTLDEQRSTYRWRAVSAFKISNEHLRTFQSFGNSELYGAMIEASLNE